MRVGGGSGSLLHFGMAKIRGPLSALAVATTGACAATLLMRAIPVKSFGALSVVAFSPYIAAVSAAGVAMAALSRRRALSAIALIVAAVSIGVQICWYHHGSPGVPGTTATIRVLSANIRNGEADPTSFVRYAEQNAEVVVVVELTPAAVDGFTSAGIERTFPYSHLIPAPLAGGIGMWSRFPLAALPGPPHPSATAPAALLAIPGVRGDTVLVGVHVKSPLADGHDTVDDWRSGIEYVKNRLATMATTAADGAVVVAGDFNATPDVRQYRDLSTAGYRDAVDQLGAGFAPTFPADRWYPPLLTIDHVLVRNSAATSIKTVRVAGSDHRGLLASIAIPADGNSR